MLALAIGIFIGAPDASDFRKPVLQIRGWGWATKFYSGDKYQTCRLCETSTAFWYLSHTTICLEERVHYTQDIPTRQ